MPDELRQPLLRELGLDLRDQDGRFGFGSFARLSVMTFRRRFGFCVQHC